MKKDSDLFSKHHFLSGGGEMGKLIRATDWSKTPLGDPENWPQSLRTMVSVVLNNPFGMYIAWGKEYTQIYNDGYRPILGATKHPHALGISTRETFAEIWHIIGSMFDGVMKGVPIGFPDFMLPLDRNGFIENCYFDFAYSPIKNDDGEVGGVLVTVIETTNKKKAIDDLKESEEKLQFVIEAAELGTFDYNPLTNNFSANSRLKKWFGLKMEGDIYLTDAIESIVMNDRERVLNAIQKSLDYSSGGKYDIEYNIKNPFSGKETILHAKARAWFNDEKIAYRLNGTVEDVTGKSEKRFRDAVKQAPLGISIFRGRDFIVEQANDAYLSIIDRTSEEFIGHPLFDAIPEVKEIIEPIFKEVVLTAKPFHGNEFEVPLKRSGKLELAYFNFVYHPLREEDGIISGIMVVAMEVTTMVRAKQQLEESEKNFRNMVMQSPIAMTILRGKDHIIELANSVMLNNIWRKSESEVIGKPILDVFPELKDQKYPELLKRVLTEGEICNEKESVAYVEGNDGMKKFFLDFEYAPLFEPDGKTSGIMITVTDVTTTVVSRKKIEMAEERLRVATEASGIATWELDLQTRHIIYSPRLAEIFGHSPSKLITYEQMRSQIHPEDIHDIVEKSFDEAMVTGNYNYEARVIKPDNTICWIRTKCKIFFEDKKPVKTLGTLQDITEEKQLQQVLQESESKFRLLADSLPQQVWTADTEGNLFYYNQNFYDYTGLTYEQLKKDGWLQIIHPDDRDENIKAWMESISNGKDFLFENRFRRYDGEYRWQLTRAVPQKDKEGNIQMWVGSSTEIQEIKEQEQQKDYFISMASHELKTPITSLKGYVQLLQIMHEKSEDSFLRNALDKMERQINTLTSLITELLDVSKIKSGSLAFNKEHFEITDLIKEVADEVRHINPKSQIIVNTGDKKKVYADRDRISQVLINLLTNAIKYSPGSDLVEVKSGATNDHVTVSVTDFGIGISKKNHERIFERFYRVEGTNENTFPGFGIGLFISSEIIRRHNGKILVDSELGKGAVFSFELPIDS